MVFRSGLMALSMKVIGLRTKLKAKEHSGMLKVTYMLESFWRIRRVGSVSTLMSMEVVMKVSGSTMYSKDRARKHGSMGPSMSANIKTE